MPGNPAGRRPARRRWTRRVGNAAMLVTALVAVGAGYAAVAPSGQADSSGQTSVAIRQGRSMFVSGCASCHGLNAQGTQRAPSLIGVGAAAVDFQVGTGRMPLAQNGPEAQRKKPIYSEDEIRQLAAFVASLAPGPAIPSASQLDTKNGDLQAGGDLFRTNCAQCHNFVGEGGALPFGAYAPSLNKTSAAHIYEAMLTGPENMPVFADSQLTPKQKLDIITYIKSIRSQADPGGSGIGRLGPVPEGLVAWLVGIGVLVLAVIWIGARA